MFFPTNDIDFKILSVLDLNWEHSKGESGVRPYHALSFRVTGNAEFKHNTGITKVSGGDMIFVPSYFKYSLDAQNEQLYVVHFVSDDMLHDHIATFHAENPSYFERKFKELYLSWSKKLPGYEYECKSIMYKILYRIEHELTKNTFSTSEERLFDVVEYIHDNFTNKDMTIEYLAKMCGVSDTYFRRIFVKNYSVTPLKYINDLKLNYAKELLRSSYYTVSEVAEKCGFENVYYFSLFMKKRTGKSPSQFLL